MSINKNLKAPIDFLIMEKKYGSKWGPTVCVQQKKESHTGLVTSG